MKKSQLENYIKKEIVNMLSEVDSFNEEKGVIPQVGKMYKVDWDGPTNVEVKSYEYDKIVLRRKEGNTNKDATGSRNRIEVSVDEFNDMLAEAEAYELTGSTGTKTVSSFRSQDDANKFKQQNPNIKQVKKLEEKEEDDDVEEKEDDWYKSKDEDGDKDKEPSKSDLKKDAKATKGMAKAKDELAILTRDMKSLAKKYKEAKGAEKDKIVADLKAKTKLKKELEAILDK